MSHALFTPLVPLDEPLLHESEKRVKPCCTDVICHTQLDWIVQYGPRVCHRKMQDNPFPATKQTIYISVLSTNVVYCI